MQGGSIKSSSYTRLRSGEYGKKWNPRTSTLSQAFAKSNERMWGKHQKKIQTIVIEEIVVKWILTALSNDFANFLYSNIHSFGLSKCLPFPSPFFIKSDNIQNYNYSCNNCNILNKKLKYNMRKAN